MSQRTNTTQRNAKKKHMDSRFSFSINPIPGVGKKLVKHGCLNIKAATNSGNQMVGHTSGQKIMSLKCDNKAITTRMILWCVLVGKGLATTGAHEMDEDGNDAVMLTACIRLRSILRPFSIKVVSSSSVTLKGPHGRPSTAGSSASVTVIEK